MPSRRERILAASEREFASHSFAGARVERIAAAAGVNKQLLFHYFGSKAGLYRAVAESVSARFDLESRQRGSTPGEQLEDLVGRLIAAWNGFAPLLHHEWRSRAIAAAKRIIEGAQRSGHFRDDVDPDSIAEVIVAASLGTAADKAGEGSSAINGARFTSALVQLVTDHCCWR